jgi:uncharacterized protein (TIGR00730 family)
MIKKICIFCGSSVGLSPVYRESAVAFGRLLADKHIGIVYGGGSIGLMGAMAEGALEGNGEVIGVIPKSLFEKEMAHCGLKQLCVVSSMHERKALMAELSDAFIALPGGLGTFEEFFEVLTWSKLEIHQKPCGLLNVDNFFDPLLALCDHLLDQGFISANDRALIISDNDPLRLLDKISAFEVPIPAKSFSPNQA